MRNILKQIERNIDNPKKIKEIIDKFNNNDEYLIIHFSDLCKFVKDSGLNYKGGVA